jgi:hypothetical protein
MGVYSRLVEPRGAKSDRMTTDQPDARAAPAGPEAPALAASAQELATMAERIAEQIRAEAERAAEQQNRQRQVEAERIRELGEISTSLSDRLGAIQRDASALVHELESAMQRLARLGGGLVFAPPPNQAPDPAPREPVAYPGTREEENGVPKLAALRAAQMALAGNDRSEIERALRAEFGIEDPSRILDDPSRV